MELLDKVENMVKNRVSIRMASGDTHTVDGMTVQEAAREAGNLVSQDGFMVLPNGTVLKARYIESIRPLPLGGQT